MAKTICCIVSAGSAKRRFKPLRISRKKPNRPGARHRISQRAMSRSARPMLGRPPLPERRQQVHARGHQRAAHADALLAVGTEEPVVGVMGQGELHRSWRASALGLGEQRFRHIGAPHPELELAARRHAAASRAFDRIGPASRARPAATAYNFNFKCAVLHIYSPASARSISGSPLPQEPQPCDPVFPAVAATPQPCCWPAARPSSSPAAAAATAPTRLRWPPKVPPPTRPGRSRASARSSSTACATTTAAPRCWTTTTAAAAATR